MPKKEKKQAVNTPAISRDELLVAKGRLLQRLEGLQVDAQQVVSTIQQIDAQLEPDTDDEPTTEDPINE